jgi:hypothetical protein
MADVIPLIRDAQARQAIVGSPVIANKTIATLLRDRANQILNDAHDFAQGPAIHPEGRLTEIMCICHRLDAIAREYERAVNPQPPKGDAA